MNGQMGDRLDLSVSKKFEAERLAAAEAEAQGSNGGDSAQRSTEPYRSFSLEDLRAESRTGAGVGVASGSVSEAFCEAVRQNQFAVLSLEPDSVEARSVQALWRDAGAFYDTSEV